MKVLTLLVLFVSSGAYAAITFDSKEYDPGGKHYTAKINVLYYGEYSKASDDRITIMYYKTSSGLIMFKGFWVSKSITAKLPVVVQKYIGKYITDVKLKETKSVQKAVEATRQAVNRALDQTWLQSLKSKSVEFSDRDLYKRDYAGFDMNYYEFFPLEKDELTNPTTLNDTIVLNVFVDSVLKNDEVLMEKSNKITEIKDHSLKKPDFDKTISWQKYRYDNLMDVIDKLASRSYHHKNLKVSDWPLANTKMWELYASTPTGFHAEVDSTCRYLMMLQATLKKEQFMPAMAWKQNYGNWKATRCNMFAGDFTQEILGLNTYPWGTKDLRAHEIHENLQSNLDFVEISWDKAWEFVNKGYPVFITIPKIGPAGHIAIAFPVDVDVEDKIKDAATALEQGMVVQAGASNGLMTVNGGFSLSATDFKAKAKVYIYLGHLNI